MLRTRVQRQHENHFKEWSNAKCQIPSVRITRRAGSWRKVIATCFLNVTNPFSSIKLVSSFLFAIVSVNSSSLASAEQLADEDRVVLETGLSFFQEPGNYSCVCIVSELLANDNDPNDVTLDSINYQIARDGDLRYCEEIEPGYEERREALFKNGEAIVVEDLTTESEQGVGLASASESAGLLTWRKRLGYMGILFGYFYWEKNTVPELFSNDSSHEVSMYQNEIGDYVFESTGVHGACTMWLSADEGFRPSKLEFRKLHGDTYGVANDGSSMLLGKDHPWQLVKVVSVLNRFQFSEIRGRVLLTAATASVETSGVDGTSDVLNFNVDTRDFQVGSNSTSDFQFEFKTAIPNGTPVNKLDGEKGVFYAWDDGNVVVDYDKKPLRSRRPNGAFSGKAGGIFLAVNLGMLLAVGTYFALKWKAGKK